MSQASPIQNSQASRIVDAFEAKLPGQVITDAEDRALFSRDISPPDDGPNAVAVVSVRSAEDVKAAVLIAQEQGVHLAVRGGGMSYTGGYAPQDTSTVLLDLTGLNRIVSVEMDNRFIVVEAGCTWAAVSECLDGTGLRPVLRGPISGSVSTVGGAVSQNLPGSMDGVIGLEVVTAEGSLVRTGSFGAFDGRAFYRNYGPDLTGLFLGDNGAFGVKTKLALRLEDVPKGAAYGSFAFDNMEDICRVIATIYQQGLASRVFGLDPLKNKTATKVDAREGLSTLKDVVTKSSKGVLGGLKDAAKIAAGGRNAMDHVEWSMHVTTEAHDQAAAESKMKAIEALCAGMATPIEPSIPIAMAAKPYSVRGMLGLKGERWVPLHGLFPYTKVDEAVAVTKTFFEQHADDLAAHKIVHSFMLSGGPGIFLIEPMFYWPDSLRPLHRAALGADRVKKYEGTADNPEARTVVARLRAQLRDAYFELGALSAQNGAFYRFNEAVDPSTLDVLKSIKRSLDPKGRLNAPSLGEVASDDPHTT